ncbi:MAG TPA: hypothetical protein VMS96_01770 [Terriglobales bacterium]|nr:hypothetical protein [Terriglobales bacterium]
MKQMTLDRVFTFGDKLSFLIPHDWIEEEEDGNYLYHLPKCRSGWFRASLFTLKSTGMASRQRIVHEMRSDPEEEGREFFEAGDNVVEAWVNHTTQDGVDIAVYYWAVGNCPSSNAQMKALFSYTVLEEDVGKPETDAMLQLLEELTSTAQFKAPTPS